MKASELRIGNWVNLPTTNGSDSFYQIDQKDFCSDYNTSMGIEVMNPI